MKNKSPCALGKCKAVVKGNPSSNLERRVKRFHNKKYKEFHNEKLSALQQRAGASSSNEPQKKRMRETNQCGIDEMFSKTIQVKMNEKTLENACLQLVTINGRPFKLWTTLGLEKILNPCLKVCEPNLPSMQKISIRKLGKTQMMSVIA